MRTALIIVFILASIYNCSAQIGKVIQVKDGDTIVILDENFDQHTSRVADIDCPERGQPFSAKARQFVSEEIFGTTVEVIEKDTDKYGRIIGYVLYDSKNLSLELLENGLAWHYKYYSDDEKMAKLEKVARNLKIGLWIDDNPINPYEWRKGIR